MLRLVLLAIIGHVSASTVDDAVTSLPQIGTLRGRHFAGFAEVNASLERNLFYWFVEASTGSEPGVTPTILWMNGGPGASSIMGLLVENIGPFTFDPSDGSLKENNHTWSRNYNLMIVDNPVGSGFSYTGKRNYVKTEEEMRRNYYSALQFFFKKHPQYQRNPIWVTGESYGGKYVPNVAYEIHLRGELALKGVLIGNGMYSPRIQYPTVADFAYAQGLIDDRVYATAKLRLEHCVQLIEQQKLSEAEDFCEDTVRWLYASNDTAGGVFYYDVGLTDASFLDKLTASLGHYLNSPETRAALHVGEHTWTQADEEGPVADNLKPDFVTDQVMGVIESLLDAGKGYRVVTYNGVRDGSLCNHLGNLLSMKALKWSGQDGFQLAETKPWTPKAVGGILAGYKKSFGALTYVTLRNTGHLVPMIVPDVSLALVNEVIGHEEARAITETLIEIV
jgi:carboxypeptidase C (cathepsin A)